MSVLKYLVSRPRLDQLLSQSSYQSFRSKSVTSKRTVTKKKYAELPALSLLCEHPTDVVPVSNTPLSLESPGCELFSIRNVRGRLLTWLWPFPLS